MLKTQDYLDLVDRHRKEIEAFPIAYAFDNKQLKRALEKLGANDISECVTISGGWRQRLKISITKPWTH